MKRLLIASTIVASTLGAASVPVLAQDSQQQNDGQQQNQEARQQAAETYVNLPVVQQMIDEMTAPETFTSQLRAQFPQIPEEDLQQISQIAQEEMQALTEPLNQAMINAAAQVMTVEELEALTEFYQTEAGSSVATKMQPFLQATYAQIGPQMQAAQQRIVQRASEQLGTMGGGGAGGQMPSSGQSGSGASEAPSGSDTGSGSGAESGSSSQ